MSETRQCSSLGCGVPVMSWSLADKCESCHVPEAQGSSHMEWMAKQPVTLDFNGTGCGLKQLAHIVILLETHGTLLIKNCAKSDTPGSCLLGMGMIIKENQDSQDYDKTGE